MFKEKTDKELSTLTTKNLLRYYRAERNRFLKVGIDILYDYEKGQANKEEYMNWTKYVAKLKSMLNAREHVESK